ncbi:hypothetical protein HDU83_005459 [Entophlyctis luteolus]|nr:hypothetical protein HDU83_005459 [Entophlyctis luteolus]
MSMAESMSESMSAGGCALLGPRRSMRSSLLFNHAVEAAAVSVSARAVVVCRSRPTAPPCLCAPFPSTAVLSRIIIKCSKIDINTELYVPDCASLRRLLASMPSARGDTATGTALPACILIDNFSSFFDPSVDNAESVAMTLALVRQTVEYIREKTSSPSCHFVISDLPLNELPKFRSIHSNDAMPIFVPLETLYSTCMDMIITIQTHEYPTFSMQANPATTFRRRQQAMARMLAAKGLGSETRDVAHSPEIKTESTVPEPKTGTDATHEHVYFRVESSYEGTATATATTNAADEQRRAKWIVFA